MTNSSTIQYLISPLSLQMMDPAKPGEIRSEQGSAIAQFVKIFHWGDERQDSITMRVVRERIEGARKFTYRTYLDKRPHQMSYSQIDNKQLTYPVVKSYRKYLVLQDGARAQALLDIKEYKQYDLNLNSIDDIPSVAKVVVEAAADNMKSFASSLDKRLLGNVDKDVALYSDQFYCANLFVVDLPKGMLSIPSLAKESLGYDMLTVVVGPCNMSKAELAGLEEYADSAKELSDEHMMFYGSVVKLRQMLAANLVQMHYVSLVYSLYELTPERLDKKVNDFIHRLPLGVRVEWLPMSQYELYKYGMPEPYHRKSFKVPTTHLRPLYPPMADLLETSGIYYGTNWLTQGPVYIDEDLRHNGFIIDVGKPGGGKSMEIKVTEERHEAKRPGETTIICVDPSETYEYLQLLRQINKIRHDNGIIDRDVEWRTLKDGLGINVLRYGAATATNVLAKLFEISTDHKMADLLFNVVERAIKEERHVLDLMDVAQTVKDEADEEEKAAYATLVHTIHRGLMSYGRIFKGEMPKGSFFANIFSLNTLEVSAAMALIMLRSRELFGELPDTARKCLIIDEGYLALADSESRNALDKISRQMRKKRLRLRFATQRPGDLAALVAKDEQVKETAVAIIEDADMVILFPHPNIAYLKPLLSLSDYSINILKPSAYDARAGRCVVIVGSGKTGRRISHTIVQIDATEDQLIRYNTDPTKMEENKLATDTAPAPTVETPKMPIMPTPTQAQ